MMGGRASKAASRGHDQAEGPTPPPRPVEVPKRKGRARAKEPQAASPTPRFSDTILRRNMELMEAGNLGLESQRYNSATSTEAPSPDTSRRPANLMISASATASPQELYGEIIGDAGHPVIYDRAAPFLVHAPGVSDAYPVPRTAIAAVSGATGDSVGGNATKVGALGPEGASVKTIVPAPALKTDDTVYGAAGESVYLEPGDTTVLGAPNLGDFNGYLPPATPSGTSAVYGSVGEAVYLEPGDAKGESVHGDTNAYLAPAPPSAVDAVYGAAGESVYAEPGDSTMIVEPSPRDTNAYLAPTPPSAVSGDAVYGAMGQAVYAEPGNDVPSEGSGLAISGTNSSHTLATASPTYEEPLISGTYGGVGGAAAALYEEPRAVALVLESG